MAGIEEDSQVGFRRRFLEQVCARRQLFIAVFVFSTMVFFVSVGLLLLVDISPESRVIAIIDAVLTGGLAVGSLALLRKCRRLERG